MKRVIVLMLLSMLLVSIFTPFTSSAATGSYIYDINNRATNSPSPAEVTNYFNGTDAGCGLLNRPEDMAFGPDGKLYVADTNAVDDTGQSVGRIVVLNQYFKSEFILSEFVDQFGNKDKLLNPKGIFVTKEGDIYIADTGNNRVIAFDKDWNHKLTITVPAFTETADFPAVDKMILKIRKGKTPQENVLVIEDTTQPEDSNRRTYMIMKGYTDTDGSRKPIISPNGVFSTNNGYYYISSADTNKVLVFYGYKFVREFDKSEVFDLNYNFKPKKVAAEGGRVFVVSEVDYSGLMLFDTNGKFISYNGANKLTRSLGEILRKIFSTIAQQEYIRDKIPTPFDNVTIDKDGFVYTVLGTVENQWNPFPSKPVRRQTNAGDDIIRGLPVGDLRFPVPGTKNASETGPSKLIDIVVGDRGVYSVLDTKRGRVFTYDIDGNMLFIFGDIGDTAGTFRGATAIERKDDKILVLDNLSGYITVFTLSDYGKLIIDAEDAYYSGNYEKSERLWKEVLKKNSNLEIGYAGLSKVYLRQNRYEEAMEYAKLGKARFYYSKAFQYYRENVVKENIYWALGVILVLVILISLFRKYAMPKIREKKPLDKYETWRGLKYAFYIIFHPFDGFWDMHHEKRGNAKAASVIYALLAFLFIVRLQFTGFLFGPLGDKEFNVLFTIGSVLIPAGLWCVCNWSITTLFNGDGKPITIYTATAYAMVPYILLNIPVIILSNFFILEEGVLLSVLSGLAVVWCGFLLFAAMLTVHQYTIGRTVVTMFATVLGAGIVLFIVMLVFSLLQQLAMFVISVYQEIVTRM